MEGSEYYWIGDRIGGIIDINGNYCINADDLVLIYEHDIGYDLFTERYEKTEKDWKYKTNLYHYAVLGNKST